jgi:hypothetical protein
MFHARILSLQPMRGRSEESMINRWKWSQKKASNKSAQVSPVLRNCLKKSDDESPAAPDDVESPVIKRGKSSNKTAAAAKGAVAKESEEADDEDDDEQGDDMKENQVRPLESLFPRCYSVVNAHALPTMHIRIHVEVRCPALPHVKLNSASNHHHHHHHRRRRRHHHRHHYHQANPDDDEWLEGADDFDRELMLAAAAASDDDDDDDDDGESETTTTAAAAAALPTSAVLLTDSSNTQSSESQSQSQATSKRRAGKQKSGRGGKRARVDVEDSAPKSAVASKPTASGECSCVPRTFGMHRAVNTVHVCTFTRLRHHPTLTPSSLTHSLTH